MVSDTFKLLNQQQPVVQLEVNNLPQTLRGIPVFRSGFNEGYHWLCNEQTSLPLRIL
jgi:hypothetical protein